MDLKNIDEDLRQDLGGQVGEFLLLSRVSSTGRRTGKNAFSLTGAAPGFGVPALVIDSVVLFECTTGPEEGGPSDVSGLPVAADGSGSILMYIHKVYQQGER